MGRAAYLRARQGLWLTPSGSARTIAACVVASRRLARRIAAPRGDRRWAYALAHRAARRPARRPRAARRRRRGRPRDRQPSSSRTTRARSLAARLEREARRRLRGAARLGPRYRFHTEVLGDGEPGRRRLATATSCCKGFGDPTLSTRRPRPRSRAQVARARDPARRPARVVGDESFFDARADGAGLEAVLRHRRVAAALGARRRPGAGRGRIVANAARSPRRAASGRARAPRASRSRGRAGLGTRRRGRDPLASSRPTRSPQIVRFMDRESDNFTAEMLLKQLGAVDGAAGARRAAGAAVVRRDAARRRASRSPACASSTARASRASTGSRPTALVGAPPRRRWTDPTLRDGVPRRRSPSRA